MIYSIQKNCTRSGKDFYFTFISGFDSFSLLSSSLRACGTTLAADERMAAVTTKANNVRESVLARAPWSINNMTALMIPDMEAVLAELVSLRVVSALRGLNSNSSHDQSPFVFTKTMRCFTRFLRTAGEPQLRPLVDEE